MALSEGVAEGITRTLTNRDLKAANFEQETLEEFGKLAKIETDDFDDDRNFERNPDDPGDICISYEPSARAFALALYSAMQRREIKCWIDSIDGDANRAPWGCKMARALMQSSIIVPLISRAYHKSLSAKAVLHMAVGVHVHVLPVYLERHRPWLHHTQSDWLYRITASICGVDGAHGVSNCVTGILAQINARSFTTLLIPCIAPKAELELRALRAAQARDAAEMQRIKAEAEANGALSEPGRGANSASDEDDDGDRSERSIATSNGGSDNVGGEGSDSASRSGSYSGSASDSHSGSGSASEEDEEDNPDAPDIEPGEEINADTVDVGLRVARGPDWGSPRPQHPCWRADGGTAEPSPNTEKGVIVQVAAQLDNDPNSAADSTSSVLRARVQWDGGEIWSYYVGDMGEKHHLVYAPDEEGVDPPYVSK